MHQLVNAAVVDPFQTLRPSFPHVFELIHCIQDMHRAWLARELHGKNDWPACMDR